ncbi:MAG: Holliday junction branch migration protein RuvA [Desulfobacterales bacterium]|jgi:Holliday junction DNA helicase RuvA|nr:Holliday junction branch migration protein RuvA [Desulfobacterales bacterium]
MIGYIQGTLLKKETDRILLLANQVGYEILLPPMVMESISGKAANDPLSFFIYFHQTERQPKPVLIGFNDEIEKEFFQLFISVEDIGPLKALKALTLPVSEIARAIEANDTPQLNKLKGIGGRTAQKIIASLRGKLDRFAVPAPIPNASPPPKQSSIVDPVMAVLIEQLGHRPADAKKMITDAFARNPDLSSPEELFDEVYRGEKSA